MKFIQVGVRMNDPKLYHIWVHFWIISVILVNYINGEVREKLWKTLHHKRFVTESVAVFSASVITQCAVLCESQSSCVAANYREGECEILNSFFLYNAETH